MYLYNNALHAVIGYTIFTISATILKNVIADIQGVIYGHNNGFLIIN